MACNTRSAALESSQKSGCKVMACSFSISDLRTSMSKMPPQGNYSIPQVLYLFLRHVGNVTFIDTLFVRHRQESLNWPQSNPLCYPDSILLLPVLTYSSVTTTTTFPPNRCVSSSWR